MKEWARFLLTYKFALDEVHTKLNILNEEFQFIHDYNPIEHVKTRIKAPESIAAKLKRKNLELSMESAGRHIHDIAGVRIICSFSTDIYRIYQMLCSQDDLKVIEVKDYIKHPKPNGYQSLHMIVEIPIFLTSGTERIMVEIQIRTSAMDFWASLEHKIYYKFEASVPESISRKLKETAEIIAALDERMLMLNEEAQSSKV
ncbi:GTP pyrophosphokinase family protein [Paenibacillus sp. MBLB4367]|uniref:GTP pyrophosphokinase n=1 Tax=Paenibacillus sp. MBLB4367 TaxID=3384767 RepID=UPI0039080122